MSSSLKLTAVALIVVMAIGYLAFLGATSSWQYYLSVDETVADAASLNGERIRVSGRVTRESLKISESRCQAEFDMEGARHKLHVSCRCAMPDNLAEDTDVVVEGVLQDDEFLAHRVITRCASKYEPKKLAARDDMTSDSAYR